MPRVEREDRILALLNSIDARSDGPINLDLERPRRVWQALGAPRVGERCVLVAGTNGKGSTTAFMESVLVHHGIRVGVYQSPWLFSPQECVRIDKRSVPEAELWIRVQSLLERHPDLTSFELFSLTALWALADANVDVAVLEIGMGGRDDVVNVADCDVAVFTPIGIDHARFLGEDRETIATVKAGILREGCGAVIGEAHPPNTLIDSVNDKARIVATLGTDYGVVNESATDWTYRSRETRLDNLPLPALPGRHQLDNAATALQACELLGTRLESGRTRRALQDVGLTGRLAQLGARPAIYADVAHNPDAARKLSEWLSERKASAVTLVLGMYRDKDSEGFLDALERCIHRLILVPTSGSRGQTAPALRERLEPLETACIAAESVAEGMTHALELSRSQDLILVTGSFATVREAYAWAAKR